MSTCTECEGRRGFYSDTGPSPRWEECSDCDGAGVWDDELPNMNRAEARKHVELAERKAA